MLSTFGILSWKDGIEILFFSSIIYTFSRWLMADRTKRLLPYFYGYLTTVLCAQFFALQTISFVLLLTAPGIVALFVLMHQQTLQKNLIGLKNITALSDQPLVDWTAHIGQFVLQQLNQKKDIVCVIERSDNLETFLNSSFMLDAPLSPALLPFILNSPSYEQHSMLWINRNGTIRGINSRWNDTPYTTIAQLYESSAAHTTHSDALFFHAMADRHATVVIKNGSIEKNITINRLQAIIRHHLSIGSNKQGGTHEYRKHAQSQQKIAP